MVIFMFTSSIKSSGDTSIYQLNSTNIPKLLIDLTETDDIIESSVTESDGQARKRKSDDKVSEQFENFVLNSSIRWNDKHDALLMEEFNNSPGSPNWQEIGKKIFGDPKVESALKRHANLCETRFKILMNSKLEIKNPSDKKETIKKRKVKDKINRLTKIGKIERKFIWDTKKDDLLVKEFNNTGRSVDWIEIGKKVLGRSKSEIEIFENSYHCKYRIGYITDKNVVDIYFTNEEQEFLFSQIKELKGSGNWKYLAFKLSEYRNITYSKNDGLDERIQKLWDLYLKAISLKYIEEQSNLPSKVSPYLLDDEKYYFTEDENTEIINLKKNGFNWQHISCFISFYCPHGFAHDEYSIQNIYDSVLSKRTPEFLNEQSSQTRTLNFNPSMQPNLNSQTQLASPLNQPFAYYPQPIPTIQTPTPLPSSQLYDVLDNQLDGYDPNQIFN